MLKIWVVVHRGLERVSLEGYFFSLTFVNYDFGKWWCNSGVDCLKKNLYLLVCFTCFSFNGLRLIFNHGLMA